MSDNLSYLENLTESLLNRDVERIIYIRALEKMLKMSSDGFWIWNIETGYLFLTWPWLSSLGYVDSDLEPHVSSWEKLCHPDDLKKAKGMLEKHFESKGKHRYDLPIRYRSKNGKWVTLRSYGSVTSWDSDKPIMMVGIVEHTNDE